MVDESYSMEARIARWQNRKIKRKQMNENRVVDQNRKGRGSTPVAAYLEECGIKATERGFVLHGISGEYTGSTSKLILECKDHGVWETTCINDFLSKARGCTGCRNDKPKHIKPLGVMSEKFMSSGGFAEGTIFSRSDRLSKHGTKPYWFVECGKCGGKYESESVNLKRGSIACLCSTFRQKVCYINSLSDCGNVIALKFGIAKDSKARLKQQQSSCVFQVQEMVVFEFENYHDCLNAERKVRKSFDCGVVSKAEMPDGYTETTSVKNYERICEIYAEMGGLRLVDSKS